MLANCGPVPYSSHHHGSKYNARTPKAPSLGKPYSSGSKFSNGLRRLQLPTWKTYETKPGAVERPRTSSPLKSWERISWEHTTMNLRNYEANREREAKWDVTHAVSTSDCNMQLPRACRSYFGDFRDRDADGVVMSTASSRVWRTSIRNKATSPLSPKLSSVARPSTASSVLPPKGSDLNDVRPATSPPA